MNLTEEQKRDLKTVVDHFSQEDRAVRERQLRTWKRLKLFWDGIQRAWYSEVAHDWRIYDPLQYDDQDQSYYDKPINVFRAYLESIIAALSVTVPPIKCYPDDADNPLDVATAKAGDKIAQLVYRHNDVQLLWLHALYIFCTEGLVACYSYPKEDEAYGTFQKQKYEEVEEKHEISTCPNCGAQLDDKLVEEFTNREKDEFQPGDDDSPLHALLNSNKKICPECAALIDPELQQNTLVVTRLVGVTTEPKTRQCIECYGGLYVKVPCYARRQEDIPYLIFAYEANYVNVIEKYPDLYQKLSGGGQKQSGPYSAYEQWARLSNQYLGEYPINTITVRNAWLRPSAFNVLPEEKSKALKKIFPDGARVVFANEEFAEAENEALDDCWTLTYNPLSDYIHHDPLGLLLTSVQEITNDLISLTLQTVEHGIGQTFVDPNVLNFNAYKQMEALPGGIYPVTPKSGKALQESFYEVKTASLSAEVGPFGEKIQQLGQLVSGALPSIFGGQLSESKTASEYAMSRSQALQRLQNVWKIFTLWWKNIFGKVIPAYIETVQEDEKEVNLDKFGNFINTYIRMAELEGKIGRVELEANENLPLTWQQKKDVVMQLLQIQNQEILAILGSPENLPIIREIIGVTDFYLPGEDDRNKQNEEIKQLLDSTPIPPDPMMAMQAQINGMPPPEPSPSVQIDPDIDNHEIQFETCRAFLVSEAGRIAKIDNPDGYMNVLLHAKQHQAALQQNMMNQQMAAQQQAGSPPRPPENTGTPIQEESNVATE